MSKTETRFSVALRGCRDDHLRRSVEFAAYGNLRMAAHEWAYAVRLNRSLRQALRKPRQGLAAHWLAGPLKGA